MHAVLTIAGSDSGGGAGIQADLRTFAAFGARGLSAVTAVTAQNTDGISCAHALPAAVVAAQIDAVAAEFPIRAAKTGMLATGPIVDAVSRKLRTLAVRPVVDPVLVSTSGSRLLDDDGFRLLRTRLLPRAAVVTPNRMEAERLSGIRIASRAEAREAAKRILDLGPAAVLVTGGHIDPESDTVVDLLDDGSGPLEIATGRAGGPGGSRMHGTGCAFSAALTAGLAAGRALPDAAADAQRHVAAALRRAGRGDGRPADFRLLYCRDMGAPAFLITTEPLALEPVIHAVSRRLADAPASAGAVTSFLGTVRNENQGRRVDRLEYEAYEPLAVKSFERIAAEAAECWPDTHVAVHHRIGALAIGEASVAIAAAAPHRADAFAACRYAIERIKQIAPIWKHEFFAGGDVWIEGATADPDDEEARGRARRTACA